MINDILTKLGIENRLKNLNRHKIVRWVLSISMLLAGFIPVIFFTNENNNAEPRPVSCTSFLATYGERVLFGDSEDANLGHPIGSDPEGSNDGKPRLWDVESGETLVVLESHANYAIRPAFQPRWDNARYGGLRWGSTVVGAA